MTDITDIREMKARIVVFGVGGAGGNAVNNMIDSGLQGVDFIVANTDAQALSMSMAKRVIQMGTQVTGGLGAGSQPEVGRAAAEEDIDVIRGHLTGAHMVFVTAGMGGGTGTGAAPIIAKTARELGILTIGVVTKPFHFEGQRRMRFAEAGIAELLKVVDTLLIIPNQNLFRVANEKTTFAHAFAMADEVLYSGVACISDLIVKEGLINLDFADVLAVMREKGKAMMGRGEASGEKRVLNAAIAAISNPLIEAPSIKRASGLIISITGGKDLCYSRSTKLPPAYAKRQTRMPTSSSARLSMKVWKVSSASRWWRQVSIISIRRARRNQWKAYLQNSPAGCATSAPSPTAWIKVLLISMGAFSCSRRAERTQLSSLVQNPSTGTAGRISS